MELGLAPVPTIDTDACAVGNGGDGCRVCVERCPYEAIEVRAEAGRSELRIDPLACQSCGACSGVCPTSAIARPFLPDAELIARLVGAAQAAEAPVVAVTCPDSAPCVAAALGTEHVVVTASLLVVNETHLLAAVLAGARRVVMVGCPRCTHDEPGLLREPLAVARTMLGDPARLTYVDAGRGHRLQDAIVALAELPPPARILGPLERLDLEASSSAGNGSRCCSREPTARRRPPWRRPASGPSPSTWTPVWLAAPVRSRAPRMRCGWTGPPPP
jgi:ferredoxin